MSCVKKRCKKSNMSCVKKRCKKKQYLSVDVAAKTREGTFLLGLMLKREFCMRHVKNRRKIMFPWF